MNNVSGCTEVALTLFGGIDQSLAPSDLPQGLSSDNLNCAFQPGSVFTRPPQKRKRVLPSAGQVIYAYQFTKPNGVNVELEFTSLGEMFADGVLIGQTAAGNRFKAISLFDKAFIAVSDGDHGADVPLQFDGTNLDRVSQDGPGAGATFAATELSGDQYPITSITQPVAQSRGSSYFLQSSGVGLSTPGNNITIYYSDSTLSGQDTDLVNAYQSGKPTYVYVSFTGTAQPFGPTTALVTGVGEAQPPGQPRRFFYFTFSVPSVAYTYFRGSDTPAYTAHYQRTLATITTATPVPGLLVGDNVSISGSSVAQYNTTWPITQTPNSGDLNITQTSLTSGTATYSYSVASGGPPTAGQSITITDTLNAGGSLNVTNGTIATATGGSVGSFTITGFTAPDATSSVESGTGVTAGTVFDIEPATQVVGTSTSPIYGNATGGNLIFAGSAAVVAPGVRQGVVFFITRNGYETLPSPLVKFTVPSNSNAIRVTNLPIGPPNVIARAVAFTAANGARFFYLPVAPQLSGVVSGTSTVVADNTSTAATFYFSDEALLASTAIDVQGNNLFRQVVLGPCLGFFPYAGRLFAWGERNKVQAFRNMGFEGGFLASAPNVPLGWNVAGSGTLVAGDYGAAWQPASGAVISQNAYQDQYGGPILEAGTQYSVRLWTTGTVVARLYSLATGWSTTATVTASAGFAEAAFAAKTPVVMPTDLMISFSGATMDELEVFYTNNPYLQSARVSYFDNPEAFDGVTGLIGPANDPHAVRTMYQRRTALYLLTYGPSGSLYETQESTTGEPVTWDVGQVAANCGAISVWGDAQFEDWQVWASDTGLRICDGGSVEKMSQEIQTWWNSFNPAKTKFVTVANDPYTRRIYVLSATGTASVNDTYVLDYRELNTAVAMTNSSPLKVGFSGKMLTTDLTRKWSPWSSTPNFCGLLGNVMTFCGGLTAATTYTLLEGDLTGVDDDYGAFPSYYVPYYMLTAEESQQLKLGPNRKLFVFLSLNISGIGKVQVTPLVNQKGNPGITTRAVKLRAAANYDLEFPLAVSGDRVAFQVACVPDTGVQAGFSLSGMTVALKDHPFAPVRGWNG